VDVSASTVINATPEQVWSYITVIENGPRWQEAAVWTHVTTPPPFGLGSEAEHEGRWMGVPIHTTGEVVLFEPPALLGYTIRSSATPEPAVMRYEIERLRGGSRLTLSNQSKLSGWLRPFEPLLRRQTQDMFERDVERLKQEIEAQVAAMPVGHATAVSAG